jgi:hypothetical protein
MGTRPCPAHRSGLLHRVFWIVVCAGHDFWSCHYLSKGGGFYSDLNLPSRIEGKSLPFKSFQHGQELHPASAEMLPHKAESPCVCAVLGIYNLHMQYELCLCLDPLSLAGPR